MKTIYYIYETSALILQLFYKTYRNIISITIGTYLTLTGRIWRYTLNQTKQVDTKIYIYEY